MDNINLFRYKQKKYTCNLIVVDNFYENPYEVRNFALSQEFNEDNYYPGKRTKSFANIEIKQIFENILGKNSGKIIDFFENTNNCSFQYCTESDVTWVHSDNHSNWAGVLYLTPNAPLKSGTNFYKSKEHNIYNSIEQKNFDININKQNGYDINNWELITSVGNIFNRLVLFNSKQYHASSEYFGNNINNSRLFQVFFFSTEY